MAKAEEVRAFWNDRAAKEERAGTRDLIAKEIEMRTLAEYVRDGMTVCDWGCGNGMTALYLAERFKIQLDGFDYSTEMIAAADEAAHEAGMLPDPEVDRWCGFMVADIREAPYLRPTYDLVFTERMLVNLDTWEEQSAAILYLSTLVKPGGTLLLMENSLTGLRAINRLREAVGLDTILSPWHNLYLHDKTMGHLEVPGMRFVDLRHYSGGYYFLSRVVNAWLAKTQGQEPEYDAPVNELALELPLTELTELPCAQGKLWVYEKEEDEDDVDPPRLRALMEEDLGYEKEGDDH